MWKSGKKIFLLLLNNSVLFIYKHRGTAKLTAIKEDTGGGEWWIMNIQNGGDRGMNWYPACYQFWQASSSFHFLAWRSERVRILWDIHPLTSASSVPLSVLLLSVLPFFSLSHHLPLTSPALSLQLGQVFVVSHPVVFHRHWDGPEPA